jgi:uncharacterized OsmC-like protein
MSNPEEHDSTIVLSIDDESLVTCTKIRDTELHLDSANKIIKGDRSYGGSGLPSPSEIFLVSIGACFGITVKSFINAWRMDKGYLSDYVDDFNIEVSEEINEIESKLAIEHITIHATLWLHRVNVEQISALLAKLPKAVQKWYPITGLSEKAVQVNKKMTLFIDGKEVEKFQL